ncbi:MAG: FAD binding domain-containing protein [Deltaproteobacteria bacterium]|nr:FAD binding domain-containing protein [Deltaproteobacteria bacterium]
MERIRFILNGDDCEVLVEKGETLLYTLRERLRLKSVKEGCGIGECGACTVLVDGKAVYSCLTLAKKVKGKHVKTVEYLSSRGLHPLQEAFIKHGAVQCGFCTPGMIISAYALLKKNRNPTLEDIKLAISGNLCRCTGYIQIVEAIASVSKMIEEDEGIDFSESVTKTKDEILFELSEIKELNIVAGGTDLLLRLRGKEMESELLDITCCPDLKGVKEENGKVVIKASTTYDELSESEVLRKYAPSVSFASSKVGSPQIRNMGTIGGNIINASPAADSIPALMIHNALCKLESKKGERTIPLEQFILSPYKTSIEKGELLTQIELEKLEGFKEGYVKVAKREALSISRVSFAYAIKEKDGRFEDVRLAIGSCTPTPFRAKSFEERLIGREKNEKVIKELLSLVFDGILSVSGDRPSFRYKFPVIRDILIRIFT